MITKLGKTELQEHQKRVLDRLYNDDTHGIIAQHSMGSGKTLTALEALRRAGTDTDKLVIVPAPLVDNIAKESDKHGIPIDDRTKVMSYERAARNIDKLLGKERYGITVFDEAHRLRNDDTGRVQALRGLIDRSDKVLMLTGTAGYNHPANVGALVQLIDHDSPMPSSASLFDHRYLKGGSIRKSRVKELQRVLGKYIDVYDTPHGSGDFPEVHESSVEIPMGDRQADEYRNVKSDTFSVRHRMASNTAAGDVGAKISEASRRMLEASKAPGFRGVAYSNFLDAGVMPYADAMRAGGIDPLIYTGSVPGKRRREILREYNTPSEDPKVLLVSSSGAEGLDLKGTRLLQVLEPHFNRAKIEQVKARGARYRSHVHLPEDQRTLNIEEYRSIMPKTLFSRVFPFLRKKTVEQRLHEEALRKQRIIDEIKAIASAQQDGMSNI